MPECGMNIICPGLTATQEAEKIMAKRLMWVDLIREIVRNAIGLIAVPGILWMLYQFVLMTPPEDKMNIMLLVIGYLGGLVTAIMGWYFGGAMRSAVAAALQQTIKGGLPNVPEVPEAPPAPVYVATDPTAPVVSGVALTRVRSDKPDSSVDRGIDSEQPKG